jgi:hypothetical protein
MVVWHMPKWFPGTYYAEFSRRMIPAVTTFINAPYNEVFEKVVSNDAKILCAHSYVKVAGRHCEALLGLDKHPKIIATFLLK